MTTSTTSTTTATTVTVTIRKERQDTALGLRLSMKAGTSEVVIQSIQEESPFAATKLQVGMQLVQLHLQISQDGGEGEGEGSGCGSGSRGGDESTSSPPSTSPPSPSTLSEGTTPQDIARRLKAAPAGTELTLTCHAVIATATKETEGTKVGLSLQKNPSLGVVRIHRVAPDGLFGNTNTNINGNTNTNTNTNATTNKLHVGQRITAINGKACPDDAMQAIDWLKEAVGEIQITALDMGGIVTTIVNKPTQDTKVGMTLEKVPHNTQHWIQVAALHPDGLLTAKDNDTNKNDDKNSNNDKNSTDFPLQVGHKLVSLQGIPCPDNVFDTVQLLKNAVGEVRIESIPLEYGLSSNVAAQQQEPERPTRLLPGQILVTALKNRPDTKVGLRFRHQGNTHNKNGGRIYIASIAPDSLFDPQRPQRPQRPQQDGKEEEEEQEQEEGARLQIGMQVVSINGVPCPSTLNAATRLIQMAPSTLYLVATHVHTAVYKPLGLDIKLGISLGVSKVGVVIAHIVQDSEDNGNGNGGNGQYSLFANTDLAVGQKVLRINDQPCPVDDSHAAVQILKAALPGRLTMVTTEVVPEMITDYYWPARCLVTATTHKATRDTKVGIGIHRSVQGRIVISKWKIPGGVLWNTKQEPTQPHQQPPSSTPSSTPSSSSSSELLQVGMVVVSINGVRCPTTDTATIRLIHDAVGELTIVVAKCVERATIKGATATTPNVAAAAADNPLTIGISIGSTRKGLVIAEAIDTKTSIFKLGLLQQHQRIVRINDQPCPDTVAEAVALLKGVPIGGTVSMEAVDALPYIFEWPAECQVSVTATKTSDRQYIGIRLAKIPETATATATATANRLVVARVEEPGLFGTRTTSEAQGTLIPGMVLVSISINDQLQELSNRTVDEVIDLMNDVEAGGTIGIVAAQTVTHIPKPSDPYESLGLTLGKVKRTGEVVVHGIAPGGLVDSMPRSLLKVRQQVIAVDGEPCPIQVWAAIELLQDAKSRRREVNDGDTNNKDKDDDTNTNTNLETIALTTVDRVPAQPWSIEEELVVTVIKAEQTSHVGLGVMRSTQGRLAVSLVQLGGLFANTGIQAGHVLVALNGHMIPEDTHVHSVMTSIQQSPKGELTLVVAKTIATAVKASPQTSLGLQIGRSRKQGVIVHSINDDSPFAGQLQARQKILSINGTAVPTKVSEVVTLLKEATEEVTIDAVDAVYPEWDQDCLIVASATKRTPTHYIGVDFGQSRQGRLVVARVDSQGLFADHTALAPGQVVLSVNGNTYETAVDITRALHEANDHVTLIVAQSVAASSKKSMDAKLGISLGMTSVGIVIVSLDKDGAFGHTRLQNGQRVIQINGMECPDSVPAAIAMLKLTEGTVELVARDVVDSPWPAKALVTALATKNVMDDKVGISFARSILGRVVVATLRKDGLLGDSALTVGQVVVSINGESAPSTPFQAYQQIKDSVGQVSIVVGHSVAIAIKEDQESMVGLTLGMTSKGVVVTKVKQEGPFVGSMLRRNQLIVSINGKPCPKSVAKTALLLKEAEGSVTVVAVDSLPYKFEWPEECLTTVTVTKKYPGQYVGLEALKSSQERIAVARVDDKGIFAKSDLKMGHILVSINGSACPGTLEETMQVLNQADGEISLVAAKSLATVDKSSKDTRLGLKIGRTRTQGVVLYEIDPQGLFGKKVLKNLQNIFSINGEDCPEQVKDVRALLQETEGTLTIEAVDTVYPDHDAESLVTAIGKKNAHHNYLGLDVLRSVQGRVCISRVDDKGLFAGSDLVPGHVIVSINGVPCPGTIKETLDAMMQADGDLAIVVASTVVRADKESADSTIGLTLGKTRTMGVIVHSVDPSGLLGTSPLVEHQKIVSINGDICPVDVQAAVHMLVDTKGELNIVAVDAVYPEWPNECIVTTTVAKESASSFVGLEVDHSPQGNLVISRIDEKGMFANASELMVGQALVSINGIHFPISTIDANMMLKEAAGAVTIITAKTIAVAAKETKDTKLGLSLGKVKGSGGVIIAKIGVVSLFKNTLLRQGQRVLTINGKECPSESADAIAMLKQVEGTLTIEAVDYVSILPGQVTVTVMKESKDSKVGMGMRRSAQNRIIISKLSSIGLLADSGLCLGQQILSINGRKCPGSLQKAVALIAQTENAMTISAVTTVATVQKESKDTTAGISLGKNSNGVVVFKKAKNGLFEKTDLLVGQKILTINGQTCPDDVPDAISLIKEAEGTLTIGAVDVLFHWSEEDQAKRAKANKAEVSEKAHTLPKPVIRVTASVEKANVDVKVGLAMTMSSGIAVISHIRQGSLFEGSVLIEGQKVVSINGEPCPGSAQEATEMIKRCVGTVTIEAEK